MGRISRKKRELELAKRIAGSLGMKAIITPDEADGGDAFVLRYRAKDKKTYEMYFSPYRPVTGTRTSWSISDWKNRWFRDAGEGAPKPTWLSRGMTLEEIDLRLSAMGF